MELLLVTTERSRLNILGRTIRKFLHRVKSFHNTFVVGLPSLFAIHQRMSGEGYFPHIQHMIVLSRKPARTRVFGIVRNCIIDAYRKLSRAGQLMVLFGNPHEDVESEGDAFSANTLETVEDGYIIHDELNNALAALQEYVSIHAKPARNGRILDMVLLEGRSLEEVAKAVGCSAPVVAIVVP